MAGWCNRRVLLLLMLCISVPSTFISAQCYLRFSGRVTDSDTRVLLEGATVTIVELRQTVVTGPDGTFQMNGICPGSYNVEIAHVNCATLQIHMHLKEDLKRDVDLPHTVSQLEEVVVVGSGRQKVTGMSSEIRGQALDATRGQTLGESLKQVTGVSVLQTGNNIYKPVIHGLHSNRVLILNNGIRQEGQQWGSEHAPEIDPFIANRITVIKGAASIRYGSDAIGGVILVEPRLLRYRPGLGGEWNTALFSNNRMGVLSGMLEGNSRNAPAFAWRIQGTVKRGGNARTPDYWLANSGVSELNMSASAGWRKENKGIELFYSLFQTSLGIFSGSHIGNITDLMNAINSEEPPDYIRNVGFTYAIDRPYQRVQHQLFKAKMFKNTGTDGRISLVLSGQHNRRREFDIVRSPRDNPQLDLNLYTGMADLVWDHFGASRLKGSIGASGMIQYNDYDYRYFIPNYRAYGLGFFAAERYTLGNWTLEAGFRFDHRALSDVTDNDQAPYDKLMGNEVIPGQPYGERNFNGLSVHSGGSWRRGGLKMGLSLATAWRAPQVNELFSNGLHHGAARIEIGDPNLNTERALNLLGNVEYADQHWSVEAGLYYKHIDNFIFLQPTYPPQLTIRGAFPSFRYAQTDARLTGADISLSYLMGSHLRFSGKVSLLRAYDLVARDWLIQMPPNRYETSAEYLFADNATWKQSYVKLSIQHVARQNRVPDSGNIEIKNPDGSSSWESDYAPPPPAYTLLGLEAGTDVRMSGRYVRVIFSVTNLLNTRYRDYMNAFRYYADDMGRNVSIRVKVPFEFKTNARTIKSE